MVRETRCIVLAEKPKSILPGLEDLSDSRQVCWGLLRGGMRLAPLAHVLPRSAKMEEVLPEVQVLHLDSVLAAGGVPGDFSVLPAIDPGLRSPWRGSRHSDKYKTPP